MLLTKQVKRHHRKQRREEGNKGMGNRAIENLRESRKEKDTNKCEKFKFRNKELKRQLI